MGTRGFVTFVIDGTEKTAYRHADAYPECGGLDVLHWLRSAADAPDRLAARARALRVASPDSAPAAEDVKRLGRFAMDHDRARHDWYWLLRRTQDDPGLMLLAGVILDAGDFPREPMARWGYVVDVNARRLEVYHGGQRDRHERGRFASREPWTYPGGTFYPVALVASWPFGELPADSDFIEAAYGSDADGGDSP